MFGFKHGFKGLNENDYVYMNDNMDMLNDDGGCCLGTSRFQLPMEGGGLSSATYLYSHRGKRNTQRV